MSLLPEITLKGVLDMVPYNDDHTSQLMFITDAAFLASVYFVGFKVAAAGIIVSNAAMFAFSYYDKGEMPQIVQDAGHIAHDWVYEPVTNWLAKQNDPSADHADL
jgi:hypothetical protein